MISVVIPAYNEEKLIGECLDSLKNQDFTGDYEIIVVDNASSDHTDEMVKKTFPMVHVISNPTNETAFFIRLKAINEKSRELALPVFVSDNYFTLLPGEKKEISIDRTRLQEPHQSIRLESEGWNTALQSVKME